MHGWFGESPKIVQGQGPDTAGYSQQMQQFQAQQAAQAQAYQDQIAQQMQASTLKPSECKRNTNQSLRHRRLHELQLMPVLMSPLAKRVSSLKTS